MVEQLTLNQLVQGSSPWRITKYGGFSAANPHIWGLEPAKSAGSSFFGANGVKSGGKMDRMENLTLYFGFRARQSI
jgi:hypothetical protein